MVAFEVSLNGRRLCTAGVGSPGVLSASVTWTLRDAEAIAGLPAEDREEAAREELYIQVGGLADGTHHDWPSKTLHLGDSVLIRVCETTTVDPPSDSHRPDPEEDLKAQREYVRRLCRKWGWRLSES